MKMIRSILYATDFSAQSEAAFAIAVALARDYGARLIMAHVMPTPTVAYTTGNIALIEPEGTAADVRARLEQLVPKDSRIAVEYLVKEGDPATELLDMVRKSGCDLIVIGTHGRSGISRLLAGSVAEQVLRHASCPVLTVRWPDSH
jgi:nucleotide-binding universal stress UspA family protein